MEKIKKLFTVCLLVMASLAWAGGTFELTVKQWKDFKKRPDLHSGEAVLWRVRVHGSSQRYDHGDETVIQCYLVPYDKKMKGQKNFPLLVICDRVTKFSGTKFDPKYNPKYDPTFGTKLEADDVLIVGGQLMGLYGESGLVALRAQEVDDQGSD